MAAAASDILAMQANAHTWASEHIDHKILDGDIDPPYAQLELADKKRVEQQGAHDKDGMMLVRCGGFEWSLQKSMCTQTSNTIKQWVRNKSDPHQPMEVLEFDFPEMDPYIFDRIFLYHLTLRVEVPDEKYIIVANPKHALLSDSNANKCNLSTSMVLIKLYEAAWKFDDNLLKHIVLSMLRTRLFQLQDTTPEFIEAIEVVSRMKDSNERNKTLNKIFLTAAVLRADDLVFSDDYGDAFLRAPAPAFKNCLFKGQVWYNTYCRLTQDTVMEY